MLSKYGFRWLYTSDFIETIDYYAKSLSGKVLPSFDDISKEADKREKDTYKCLARLSAPEWFDPAGIVDQSRDAGIDFYIMAEGVVQGIINMFTAGLYHLFEQQLFKLYRQEWLGPMEIITPKFPEKARECLRQDYQIDISTFACWSKLAELRLVANTVKHADGLSCTDLKQVRPDLFIHPSLKDDPVPWTVHRQVFLPLAGEDLYISCDDFTKYADATKQFWEELANALDQLPD